MARPLFVSLPNPELRSALGDPPEGVAFLEWDLSVPAPRDVIDLVVVPYMGSLQGLARLANVSTRLVQGQSMGYDGVADLLPPGHLFANAAGVHDAATAELAVALILASQRGLPDFVLAASRREWTPEFRPSLADRTVLLVGYGGVGHAIEARLLAFETTVVRVASRERTDARGRIYGIDSLHDLLPAADVVVVAVPLSPATTHLINETFLARLSDGSLLVNVARGRVADTEALVAAARSGRIRLALDVTDPEPLPADHPLWALPDVLISPHVGGATSAMLPRMAKLVHEQISRMRNDEVPLHVVLPSRGPDPSVA